MDVNQIREMNLNLQQKLEEREVHNERLKNLIIVSSKVRLADDSKVKVTYFHIWSIVCL